MKITATISELYVKLHCFAQDTSTRDQFVS